MRITKNILRATCLIAAVCAVAAPAGAAGQRDLGNETLHPQNGWAASGAGVTGGSLATATQIYTVTNRQELVAAVDDADSCAVAVGTHQLVM